MRIFTNIHPESELGRQVERAFEAAGHTVTYTDTKPHDAFLLRLRAADPIHLIKFGVATSRGMPCFILDEDNELDEGAVKRMRPHLPDVVSHDIFTLIGRVQAIGTGRAIATAIHLEEKLPRFPTTSGVGRRERGQK